MKATTSLTLLLGAAMLSTACEQTSKTPSNPPASYGTADYLCKVDGDRGTVLPEAPKPQNRTFTPVQNGLQQFRLPNKLEGQNLTVYFVTNSAGLEANDRTDLRNYVRTLDAGTVHSLLLESYADPRGSEEDNNALTQTRGQSIASAIANIARNEGRQVSFDYASYGETKSTANSNPKTRAEKLLLRPDRRVTIIPNESVIQRSLSLAPADFYLLDQSGSMGQSLGNTIKWDEVASYKYPSGAELYTFSSGGQPCDISSLRHLHAISPEGETPLYASLETLMSRIPKGKIITILTDGESNEGRGYGPDLASMATSKGIRINTIQLGGSYGSRENLKDLAIKTGGTHYARQY